MMTIRSDSRRRSLRQLRLVPGTAALALLGLCAAFLFLGAEPAQAIPPCATCPAGSQPSGNFCVTFNPPSQITCPPAGGNSSHSGLDFLLNGIGKEISLAHDADNPGQTPEFMSDDPFFNFTSIHDGGASVSSANGTVSGRISSSTTTVIGGGAAAGYNGFSKSIGLSNNQNLIVGIQGGFDSYRRLLAPARS
jgi:hypothetical protein